MQLILSVIAILFAFYIFTSLASSNREMLFEILPPCPENDKLPSRFDGVIVRRGPMQYGLNGSFVVERDFAPNGELLVQSKRCTMDMLHCEKFDDSYMKLCGILKASTMTDKTFMSKVKPPLPCPFKANRYDLRGGYVDMDFIKRLPLTGYHWMNSFKAYEIINGKKRLAFCMSVKMTMLNKSDPKNGTHTHKV